MENLEMTLSLVGTIIGLLITVLTFLIKLIKNIKARKLAEQVIKIGNAILPYIREAEKFTAFSGEEKKAYVMTKANQLALANHIAFDENQVSTKIEELVALTKQVNVKANAKEKAEINMVSANKTWL